MPSFALAAVFGILAGLWHMLLMRRLAGKMVRTSGAPGRIVLAIAFLRLAPAVVAAFILVVWGAGMGLGILSGYWIGRTGVLGATIARSSG